MPALIIDSPDTRTKKVALGVLIKWLFKSNLVSMKSSAGLGKPAATFEANNGNSYSEPACNCTKSFTSSTILSGTRIALVGTPYKLLRPAPGRLPPRFAVVLLISYII